MKNTECLSMFPSLHLLKTSKQYSYEKSPQISLLLFDTNSIWGGKEIRLFYKPKAHVTKNVPLGEFNVPSLFVLASEGELCQI